MPLFDLITLPPVGQFTPLTTPLPSLLAWGVGGLILVEFVVLWVLVQCLLQLERWSEHTRTLADDARAVFYEARLWMREVRRGVASLPAEVSVLQLLLPLLTQRKIPYALCVVIQKLLQHAQSVSQATVSQAASKESR